MSFQHKENKGSLFKNDKKEKETQPDYKGSALINGKEMYVSAWINETKSGQKYFSMSFEDKEKIYREGMADVRQAAAAPQNDNFDDDIPF